MVSSGSAAAFDRVHEEWVYEPRTRPRSVAQLPGVGVLAGVGDIDGQPLVLVDRDPARPGAQAQGTSARQLLRLRLGQWESIDLPSAALDATSLRLLLGSPPTLLIQSQDMVATNTWAAHPIALQSVGEPFASTIDVHQFIATGQASEQGIVLTTEDIEAGEATLSIFRRGTLYPLASVPGADESTTAVIVSLAGDPALLRRKTEGRGFEITPYALDDGQPLPTVDLAHRLAPRLEDFSLLVLIFAMLLATIIMYLFRPSEAAQIQVSLPRGIVISEPRRRLAALLIDIFPSGLLVGLILQLPLSKVFSITGLPMRGGRWEDSWPFLLALFVTITHESITETLTGRTLGKWMMDCRVVDLNGAPVGFVTVLLRNSMKFIALLVPLLFFFVYLNPFRQHLGDLVARTVVVTSRETDPDAPPPTD